MTKKTISFQQLTESMTKVEIEDFIESIKYHINARKVQDSNIGKNDMQIYIVNYFYYYFHEDLEHDNGSDNMTIICDLIDIIGEERYQKIADKYHGKYVYISLDKLNRVKRDMGILHALENTNRSSNDIGKDYGITGDAVRMIKNRYKKRNRNKNL